MDRSYGAPPNSLTDDEIAAAVPDTPPSKGEIGPAVYERYLKLGVPELQARTMAWSAAIKEAVTGMRDAPSKSRLVTYEFVQMKGLRLAAIFYVQPQYALRRAPTHIDVEGRMFPVLVRPYVPVDHADSCRFSEGVATGDVRLASGQTGILTAAHVAAGSRAAARTLADGDSIPVIPNNGTPSPAQARLLRIDGWILDAAVIEWPIAQAAGRDVSHYDARVPVRMMFPNQPIEARVIGSSLPDGIIPGVLDDVRSPAVLITNRHGAGGDSGSLVYDISNEEKLGAQPYLMYQGIMKVDTDRWVGQCLMLEQVRKVWGVELVE